jgi:hypothetical protein
VTVRFGYPRAASAIQRIFSDHRSKMRAISATSAVNLPWSALI